MRFIVVIFLLSAIIFGCARKTVPAAGTTSSQAPAFAVPAPDAGKMDSANTSVLSNKKMIAVGHDVFIAKCGRCHELKKVDDFTAADWDPILASMAPKAGLTEAETANVLAYVKANAKK